MALVARLGVLGRSPVTPLNFAWQAWRLATSTLVLRGRCGHLAISTLVLCGKRGACSYPPSFCVAGVVLMALGWLDALGRAWSLVLPLNFTWQAWHLATSTLFSRGRRGTWHGRRGTWRYLSSVCVAGVALGDIYLGFAW